jgi:hypothetical protein
MLAQRQQFTYRQQAPALACNDNGAISLRNIRSPLPSADVLRVAAELLGRVALRYVTHSVFMQLVSDFAKAKLLNRGAAH